VVTTAADTLISNATASDWADAKAADALLAATCATVVPADVEHSAPDATEAIAGWNRPAEAVAGVPVT